MKTGILFDLDGTLLDTLQDIAEAANHALEVLGYPRRSLEEMCSFVGNGARVLLTRAAPAGADVDKLLPEFHSYYRSHAQVKTAPYPGIMEALEKIRQRYPIAIVSNKPDPAVKLLCDHYFPGVYARGESTECPRKPAPDMVFRAMEAIGVEHCIYVGDSEVDVETAKNAGMPCLSVLWGFREKADMEAVGAVYFCAEPAKLPEIIEEINHGK